MLGRFLVINSLCFIVLLPACANLPHTQEPLPSAAPQMSEAGERMTKMRVVVETLLHSADYQHLGYQSLQDAVADLHSQARLIHDRTPQALPLYIAKNEDLISKFKSHFAPVVKLCEEAAEIVGPTPRHLSGSEQSRLKKILARINFAADNGHASFKELSPTVSPGKTTLESILPVDRTRDQETPERLSGDDSTKAHSTLWNATPGNPASTPPVTERFDTVIVGGGMSGLVAYYHLLKTNPNLRVLLLEQASRLGGNSRGENWKGLDYSIGAAYIGQPTEGELIHKFLNEIGILPKMKAAQSDDEPLYLNGHLHKNVWNHGTSAKNKKQFNKLRDYFKNLAHSQNGLIYPQIPPPDQQHREYIAKLDQHSFKAHLQSVLAEKLDPDLEALLDRYCWSTFDARINEVSAPAALNFLAGDLEGILVAPGGNAGIAEALVRHLARLVPLEHLRVNSLVYKIRVLSDNNGAEISYLGLNGERKTIAARKVIFAAPKFVAARVIEGLETDRLRLIQTLQYRSYLVANLLIEGESLLNKKGQPRFFDAFFVDTRGAQDGSFPSATDVVYGNYAQPDRSRVILTIYRPLPYDHQRGQIAAMDYEKLKEGFDRQIREEIMPKLKINEKKIASLRIARWAHPFPVAKAGLFSVNNLDPKQGGPLETISRPFRDTVYFANQDNWVLPGFEALFESAKQAASAAVSRK